MTIINMALGILFGVCYLHQFFYIPVAFFKKRKPVPQNVPKTRRYAILIAARNEEGVIGYLIESIKKQDYPAENLTTFVVADNCTDDTARVAREAGAIVYERHELTHIGKGYAMQFLLGNIARDFPERFDGYFVFDADNLLAPDYVSEMNRYFGEYEIVTSYRNAKNYGDNWISAGYGLWWLRENRFLNDARCRLGTSCAISGTGFLYSDRVLQERGGWNYFLLTEDIEFTIDTVSRGQKIGYCPTAMFYDEQPVTFKQSWKQRSRWVKGYYQVFHRYGWKLFKNFFRKGSGFASFDMFMNNFPALIISIASLLINGIGAIVGLCLQQNVWFLLYAVGSTLLGTYSLMFVLGLITALAEWKNIQTTKGKKIGYLFTFPIFIITYLPIAIVGIFHRTGWDHIEHKRGVSIEQATVVEEKRQDKIDRATNTEQQ
ncbi:MAG: glycosyltransferase family 2 protein [Christensenellaceae bacterium]